MHKKYVTSKNEINRRKKAFTSLEISFLLSVCVFSIDVIFSFPEISILCIFIISLILFSLSRIINKVLDKQSYLEIFLSDSELQRNFKNASEKYLLDKIKSIRIKRTTRGLIREIRLNVSGENAIFINGLEDFENFKDDLINATNDIKIINYKEPIDFDHPLYYVFFGTIVGTVSTLLFRLMFIISQSNIKYVQFLLDGFIIIMGLFWIISKPIRSRYGNKNIISDYIFGLSILIIGLINIIYLY